MSVLAEDDGLQNSIHVKAIKLGNADLDFESTSLLEPNLNRSSLSAQ